MRRVRWATVALAVPGMCNWACFHFVQSPRYENPFLFDPLLNVLAGGVNLILAGGSLIFAWFAALKAFDLAASLLHLLFGGRSTRREWLDCLYDSLWPLTWAARIGALCWLAWLAFFYFLDFPPLILLNNFFGALGHILAAWVYLTVIVNWFRLRRRAAARTPEASDGPESTSSAIV